MIITEPLLRSLLFSAPRIKTLALNKKDLSLLLLLLFINNKNSYVKPKIQFSANQFQLNNKQHVIINPGKFYSSFEFYTKRKGEVCFLLEAYFFKCLFFSFFQVFVGFRMDFEVFVLILFFFL